MRTAINLLPSSFRRQQILRKRLVQWASIISTVLVVGWAWHWYDLREGRQLAQQLETLTREHTPAQVMLKQLIEMRKQLKQLEEEEAVAKVLDCQRNALTVLGLVSESAQDAKGRLRVTKFNINNFQDAQPKVESSAVKGPELTLGGEALDNPAVTELFDRLQDSGIFRPPRLRNKMRVLNQPSTNKPTQN